MPTCRNKLAMLQALPLMLIIISGCQTGASSEALSVRSQEKPTPLIVTVAKNAQKCWFKSGDNAFKAYKLANEVNSHSGRPRILLVPRNNPGGLPQLVVQAEQKGSASSGTYTNMQAYGPLLGTSSGKRITDDVKRWSAGNSSCKT